MTEPDYDSDERDGVLFRFWNRMASYPEGSPSKLMKAFEGMTRGSPAEYRRVLTELAQRERINLP